MIRFIDLRSALDVLERFAYFDTVTDKFVEVGGSQTFSDWDDFEACARGEGIDLPRFKGLTPSWAFESAQAVETREIALEKRIAELEKECRDWRYIVDKYKKDKDVVAHQEEVKGLRETIHILQAKAYRA